MSDVIGATAAFIFFFFIPPTPAADGFSIRPSVDRSIDRSAPRDRLSNRDRSAVSSVPFICGQKEKRPTPANSSQKQGQQVLGVARMDTYMREGG